MTKRARLGALIDAYKECRDCSLHKNRHSVVVADIADFSSHTIFIGEAPGRDEDWSGVPFIGRSGRLLRATLAQLGVKKPNITNVCACRPPNNRRPFPDEICACKPRLIYLLAILQPRTLVLLGNTAVESFAPLHIAMNPGLLRFNHYPFQYPTESGSVIDAKITTAYHPSYILRNPKDKETWIAQLRSALELA